MASEVAILGGGIAGLSAAHELVERDFDVTVYEKRERFGGKARSLPVPETGGDGKRPLPGEHGFRFFPAFYRHVFDTMSRIPYGDNEDGVADNLEATTQWMIAREAETEVEMPLELPDSIDGWETVLEAAIGNPFDVPDAERQHFVDKVLTFLTTCEPRRREEYEHRSWWEFIDAEEMSEAYQEFFGVGLTRSLVAMQAEESSTRTIGRIYVQLLLGIAMPWLDADRVLDGPTSEVWIDPWAEHLRQGGAELRTGTAIERIECVDGRVAEVQVTGPDGDRFAVTADHYLAALPVEVMTDLVTDRLASAAPALEDLDELETAWMNGIQFYLDRDAPITHGHVIYQGSPWALTSISQQQFWESDLSEYGEAAVEGILSVCISNWTDPGTVIEKPAKECRPEEIKREVWAQITEWLNDEDAVDGHDALTEDNVVEWFLDPAVEFPAPNEATNAEPLLVNTVGSLEYRPEADTAIPNLYLAADYVRTNTDLATMEAANEAARRAVNAILSASGSDAAPCQVWDLEEPAVFEPMKAYDRLRFRMGLPHGGL